MKNKNNISITSKRMIGNLSKRHSAPARKQTIVRRAAQAATQITQSVVIRQEKSGR